MDERIFAAVETPFLLTGLRINGVKIAVPTAHKDDAVYKCGRSVHDIAGFEFPAQIASRRVQRIEVAIAAPKINRAVRHYRARQKNIERISHRLVLRLQPIQPFRFKTPLATGGELPFQCAGLGI